MKNINHWPPHLPQNIELPETSLYDNLAISALRYLNRPAIIFYDKALTYAQLKRQVV